MLPESIEIPFVLGTIVLMVVFLVSDRFKTSLVFLFTIAVLLVGDVIPAQEFVAGLSNTSVITIFLLIIVTAAVNDHFDLTVFFDRLFGKTSSIRGFLLKMGATVATISAFMNNTPVVAMMMPYVYGWGKRHKVNPSKLLIPLSYVAIVGGVITLIGTSTNLVLNGMLEANGLELLTFTDFLVPGLLVAGGSILFLFLFAPSILGNNKDLLEVFEENKRQYIVETIVSPHASIIGLTVEEAGLRNLEGIFLTEIVRGKKHYTAVSPDQQVQGGDILLFAGETAQIFELLHNGKGLELSKKQEFNLGENISVLEAVVVQNSFLDRKTVKEIGFREKYDAAIIGIHRRGEKVSGKIGSMEIHTGDLLLISPGREFADRNRRNEDLIVINTMKPRSDFSKKKKMAFITGFVASVLLAITGILNLFEALLLIVFIQVVLGMLNLEKVKNNISIDLLIILIASLALGQALIDSGAAEYVTDFFFAGAEAWSPFRLMCIIFLVTFILTSFITNVAAVSIIFPVVFSVSQATGMPDKALFLTAAYAASCCFVTPFAYQTNLMVMEAGNYKFNDFVKLGLPLSVVYAIIYLTYAAFKFDMAG